MIDGILARLVPNQAGTLWIALLVAFLVFGDFERLWSRRNIALAGLLLLAPLLVDIFSWEGRRATVVFTAIFAVTALYTVWGVVLGRGRARIPWQPRVGTKGLVVLLAGLLVLNAAVTFGRLPDDAGAYANLGAQRWRETGALPYGDPVLTGADSPGRGAAATYGPVLYALHLPFQWLLGAPRNPPEADPRSAAYARPPVLATQLVCFAVHLVGVFALVRIVAGTGGQALALGVAAIYASSPYVVGIGSDEAVVGGLRFISHIVPTSLVLLALLVAVARPGVAGLLLGAAAGTLFYPVFFVPLWLGWYVWRGDGALRFLSGFGFAAVALVALLYAFAPATEGTGPVSLFLESTLGHQEGTEPGQYGTSSFGFWGVHPGLAAFWQAPLAGTSTVLKPIFLAYAAFVISGFFLARGRTLAQLAGLTAALAAAVQLWKTHGGGTYVNWFFPLLLVAVFVWPADASPVNSQRAVPNAGDPPG